MTVQVGQLFRKRTVRRLSGEIIEMSDETDGSGVIISKGRVVNQEKVNEIANKEKDRALAGKAEALQITNPDAPDRTNSPSKMVELEKRVDDMDGKLDQILKALTKK